MACIRKIHISRKGYEIQNYNGRISEIPDRDSPVENLHHFKPNQSLRMLLSSVQELDEIEDMIRKGFNDI